MALTVCRTTYSGVLRDIMDFSTALTDAEGRLIAQGLDAPGPPRLGAHRHRIGAAPLRRRHASRRRVRDERPVRRRHAPAGHLHHEAVVPRAASASRSPATVCHHTDVGGRVAGSNASDSTEIYAGGRCASRRSETLRQAACSTRPSSTFIEKQRAGAGQAGAGRSCRAQLAACHIAERAVCSSWSSQLWRLRRPSASACNETIEYAERLTRAALRELPDGEWSFEDWIDDDGIDRRPANPVVRDASARTATGWSSIGRARTPQVKRCHQQHAVVHQVRVLHG